MANPLHGRRDEMLDTFLLRPEPRTQTNGHPPGGRFVFGWGDNAGR